MNSRDAQDVILRLLADGPFRAAATSPASSLDADTAGVLARLDLAGLERFGRFLCRHYYRERVVHYFKYSRALVSLTARPPEAALKTPEFHALVPALVMGERASAERVLELLRRFLTGDADSIRARIPYWDDLIAYQGAFFLSDAVPTPHHTLRDAEPWRAVPPAGRSAPSADRLSGHPAAGVGPRFPARAETASYVELGYDLPAVLPLLLKPFTELPAPARKPTRLLLARSPHGEVTAIRCTDALKGLLDSLTGEEPSAQVAARLGVDPDSFEKTLRKLEELGAVVARESFSSSHTGSAN